MPNAKQFWKVRMMDCLSNCRSYVLLTYCHVLFDTTHVITSRHHEVTFVTPCLSMTVPDLVISVANAAIVAIVTVAIVTVVLL